MTPTLTTPRPPAPPPSPGAGSPSGHRPWTPPFRADSGDQWPRTGRVMPWLIAAFLAMVMLTPFDSTELRVSLPVDAKLDRLLIVAMAVTWIATYFAGGASAPRWRPSPLNIAILVFVGIALLSVIVNIGPLFREDELSGAIKRLSVLGSWVVLFFVVATTVRPRELDAFVRLLLGLAAITAIGVLYEYFTGRNLFFEWWSAIVPDSVFQLRPEPTTPNRFVAQPITGPMQHALALATTMAIALSFAVVRLLQSRTTRDRAIRGALTFLLLLAVFATSRKTGSFATVAMLATLVAMRPRQMLRLAPVAFVLFALALFMRPEAVNKQLDQLRPGKIATDASGRGRTEDYYAITPDVRERVLLGKGYGTYDPKKYRIIDNEALVLLLETGLVGLISFGLVIVMVPVIARRPIRAHDPRISGFALAGAGAAGAIGTALPLFDLLGFTAPVYAFFFVAGGVVVAGAPVRRLRPGAAPTALPAELDPLERLARELEGIEMPLPRELEPEGLPPLRVPVADEAEALPPLSAEALPPLVSDAETELSRAAAPREEREEHRGGRPRDGGRRFSRRPGARPARMFRRGATPPPGAEPPASGEPPATPQQPAVDRDPAAPVEGAHGERVRPATAAVRRRGGRRRGPSRSQALLTTVTLGIAVLLFGRGGDRSQAPIAQLGSPGAVNGAVQDPFAPVPGAEERPAAGRRPARPAQRPSRHIRAGTVDVARLTPPVASPAPSPAPRQPAEGAPERPEPKSPHGRKPTRKPKRPERPTKPGGDTTQQQDTGQDVVAADCLPGDTEQILRDVGIEPCPAQGEQQLTEDVITRAFTEGRLSSEDFVAVLASLREAQDRRRGALG